MFNNFKSLKIKLAVLICSLILVIVAVFIAVVAVILKSSAMDHAEITISESLSLTKSLINSELESYLDSVEHLGELEILTNPDVSNSEKQTKLSQEVQELGFISGNITDINGNCVFTDKNIGDTDYFKTAIKGETNFSNVFVSENPDECHIVFAAPLRANGASNGSIVGVAYLTANANILSEMVKNIEIGKTGSVYILDNEGYTIAHPTIAVENRDNILLTGKNDSSLKDLYEVNSSMTEQETDTHTYTYAGVKKTAGYMPLENAHNWSVNVNMTYDELTQGTNEALLLCCILSAILLFLSTVAVLFIANTIGRPIRACARRLEKLADGDLDSEVKQFKTKDEIGRLSNATLKITNNLSSIIRELSTGLSYMSEGVFTYKGNADGLFVGGYKPLFDSYHKITTDLSETMKQITVASDQVNTGAEQISDSSQAMAQGATEQAASIEELAGTLNEVMDKINRTAADARNAKNITDNTVEAVKLGSSQMQDVMSAMSEIDEKSKEINKIIKAIDDIAFQTNILSLNAAVEAARAGEAGKGFAVVADEVRNLAAKSAQSAKDTAALIQGTIAAIEVGNSTVEGAYAQLEAIMQLSEKVSGYVDSITKASKEEADAVELINIGVEQISSVVQTNSATAEESAASSEELSSQSQMMKTLMDQFKTL